MTLAEIITAVSGILTDNPDLMLLVTATGVISTAALLFRKFRGASK